MKITFKSEMARSNELAAVDSSPLPVRHGWVVSA